MNQEIADIQRRNVLVQRTCWYMLYMCYTLTKIVVILLAVFLGNEDPGSAIVFFLLFHVSLDIFEVLFSALICSLRQCCNSRCVQKLSGNGQLACETLRFISLIGILSELITASTVLNRSIGIVALVCFIIGMTKYIMIGIGCVLYCLMLNNIVVNEMNQNQEHLIIPNLQIYATTVYQGTDECSICMLAIDDENLIVKLNCEHLFHLRCLEDWVRVRTICPICRRRIN